VKEAMKASWIQVKVLNQKLRINDPCPLLLIIHLDPSGLNRLENVIEHQFRIAVVVLEEISMPFWGVVDVVDFVTIDR
jgi:hypothetical protein